MSRRHVCCHRHRLGGAYSRSWQVDRARACRLASLFRPYMGGIHAYLRQVDLVRVAEPGQQLIASLGEHPRGLPVRNRCQHVIPDPKPSSEVGLQSNPVRSTNRMPCYTSPSSKGLVSHRPGENGTASLLGTLGCSHV